MYDLNQKWKNIDAVVYTDGKSESKASFDYYFLTSGAFESSRILMSSGLMPEKVHFSDHLSMKVSKSRALQSLAMKTLYLE